MSENVRSKGPERRKAYELLTAKIAPFASEGDSIIFDRIANAPVDPETGGRPGVAGRPRGGARRQAARLPV